MKITSTKIHSHYQIAICQVESAAPTSRGTVFARGSAVLQYVSKDLRAAGLIRLAS
jgi:hypothetical protein